MGGLTPRTDEFHESHFSGDGQGLMGVVRLEGHKRNIKLFVALTAFDVTLTGH
jgi:hypothetical protein